MTIFVFRFQPISFTTLVEHWCMVVSLHNMDALYVGLLALDVGSQHLVVFVKYLYPNLHAFLLIVL